MRPWLALAIFAIVPAVVLGFGGGCGEPEELDGDDFCNEVGYAIANRTFVCTNDADLGNERFEKLQSDYRCQTQTARTHGRQNKLCPVLTLSCDEVKQNGDNLDWWIARSQCTTWFLRKDGSSIPPLLPDGGIPPTCQSGQELCDGVCTDLDNDSARCGACGAQCPPNTTCINRVCEFN